MNSTRGGGQMVMARETVVWDASPLPAEIATVDALARLALLARRNGVRLELGGVSPALWELIDLAGLAVVLLTFVATSPWCFRHQSDQ
jgi:hypothetical protein